MVWLIVDLIVVPLESAYSTSYETYKDKVE